MKGAFVPDLCFFSSVVKLCLTTRRFRETQWLILEHLDQRKTTICAEKRTPVSSRSWEKKFVRCSAGQSATSRTQAQSQAMEASEIGKRSRQVQHDSTHRGNHLSSDFQKTLPQGRDLLPGRSRTGQP